MAYTNNNKRVWDTPVWELTNQLRQTTSAVAGITQTKETVGRYTYYIAGGFFYRYDTYRDTHMKLATPPLALTTTVSLRYSSQLGYYGNNLGAAATSITIPPAQSNLLVGQTIQITSGTGAGQNRTISSVVDPVIQDSGLVTAASATALTDTTKRWAINQWVGYQVRVTYGTGASQVRKVLYNDAQNLYFQDNNYQQLEVWNNTTFSNTAPYVTPAATAGAQSMYTIEAATVTISSPWTTIPDESSSFLIKTGGLFLITSVASAPWAYFMYYDVLTDTWTTKTAPGGNLLAALGTDFSIEIIDQQISYLSGTASSSTNRTLVDNTQNMTVDFYVNYMIRITNGTGIGQYQRIVSNGTNYFEVPVNWSTQPDNTSTYAIYGNTDTIWLSGNGASSLYQYLIDQDAWVTGNMVDFGQTRNISLQYPGQEAFAISSGTIQTGSILGLSATPTAGGTGYFAGDTCNITTGGSGGKCQVVSVSNGVVTAVTLLAAGNTYTTGTGKATTNILGVGTGLTVNITSVGNTARVTTVQNHNLLTGDGPIIIYGATESAWNSSTFSVLATDTLTTFDMVSSAQFSVGASSSQSTTVIVDAFKNWVTNEHVGKLVKLDTVGTSPTTQLRRIVSNTPSTLTVASITAAVNGTSRYVIMQPPAFGRDRQYRYAPQLGEGHAATGSSTTLVDTSKNWINNVWAGAKFRILAGTGVGNEITITSNTSNTLNFSSQTFSPDITTKYDIMDTYGIATAGSATTLTDTTKNWIVNQWAGKYLVYTSGTGQRTSVAITSNTATVLTFGSTTSPDTTTMYTILSISPRSTGHEIFWGFNLTNPLYTGRYLMSVRGGGNTTIDRYNISLDKWDFQVFYSPQSDTFNTGSSYAYDGGNNMYLIGSPLAGDFIYIYVLNLSTLQIDGSFQTTNVQGTLHIGNFMSIVTSPDGGMFLYLILNTSKIMYKSLIS